MLVIRNFDPSEGERVTAVVRASWEQYAEEIPQWNELLPRLGALVENAAHSEVIVAESDGQLVGAVAYVPAGSPKPDFFPPDWPIVRLMSVMPNQRGQGIGQRLLEECVTRAKRDQSALLALHSTAIMHSALRLYARHGFNFHSPLPSVYGVPGVLLVKQLAYFRRRKVVAKHRPGAATGAASRRKRAYAPGWTMAAPGCGSALQAFPAP